MAETQAGAPTPKGAAERGGRGGRSGRGGGRDRGPPREREESELIDRLAHINRVAKVVKGGRRFSFGALVIVGDGRGRVGFGSGKAREVPEAIRKATDQAKRRMIRVPLREGRTLHHDVSGHFGAAKVVLRAAVAGTGIIAGGPMRAIFETMGVKDVVAKSLGTTNPHNMVKATFKALGNCVSPRGVAARRGRKVGDILARRGDEGQAALAGDTRGSGGALPTPSATPPKRALAGDTRGSGGAPPTPSATPKAAKE